MRPIERYTRTRKMHGILFHAPSPGQTNCGRPLTNVVATVKTADVTCRTCLRALGLRAPVKHPARRGKA